MSEEEKGTTPTPEAAEEENASKTSTMATETEENSQTNQNQDQKKSTEPEITKKFEKMNITLSIWPPTQRTRDAVINRLIETLSAPSILSKRYGSLPAEEASSTARIIEEEAFSVATTAFSSSSSSETTSEEDDGIEILQIYSKEISKRMLEAVKARAASASPSENDSQSPAVTPAVTPGNSEEISSTEPGSS